MIVYYAEMNLTNELQDQYAELKSFSPFSASMGICGWKWVKRDQDGSPLLAKHAMPLSNGTLEILFE